MLHPGMQPTPVLAWSITGLNAAAGVVVTASHNPPADNGYKVFLDTGSQIVTPIDTGIALRIGEFDPLDIPIAHEDDHLISWLDTSWNEAYVADVPRVRLRPDVAGVKVATPPMHGVGGDTIAAAFTARFVLADRCRRATGAGRNLPDRLVSESRRARSDGSAPWVAQANGADIALANDPDADRLGGSDSRHT